MRPSPFRSRIPRSSLRPTRTWSCRTTPGNSPAGAVVALLLLSAAPAWGGEGRHPNAPPEARALPPPARGLILGERLTFQGRWMGIPVGEGSIEVKELIEIRGRPAYHIEMRGRSNDVLSAFYPIRDEAHSYLDAETLRPLKFEKHQREGHYRASETVWFDHATSTATYESLLNGSTKQIDLPKEFQDLLSAFYWFRAQPVQPSQTLEVNLY